MYMLTNKQWDAVVDVVWYLLPEIRDFKTLTEEQQNKIIRADIAIVEATKRKREMNKRTANYIAEKRKDNKNYAR